MHVETPAEPQDVQHLIARVRNGDHAAYEAFVRRFWDLVMRVCWNRVPVGDAEDLTQQAFVSVYQAIRKGKGPRDGKADRWRGFS